MKPTVVLATRNKHKIGEILDIMPDIDAEFKTLDDFPGAPDVVEDAATLRENAVKKAKSAASYCGEWALADDTGLEVDALGGAPGVLSARYAGDDRSCSANNSKLLAALSGVAPEKRTARFRCVMALASAGGSVITVEGLVEGRIAGGPSGARGFGYDPLFIMSGSERTFAELATAEKNTVSHRSEAIRRMAQYLRGLGTVEPGGGPAKA